MRKNETLPLRECIDHALRQVNEGRTRTSIENQYATWRTGAADAEVGEECAVLHNRCAASFALTEGCEDSPALCVPSRLMVVRMGDLNAAAYMRLVRWASRGMATQEYTPKFKTQYNQFTTVDSNRWVAWNGTRYPREISLEMHTELEKSYATDYSEIEWWLAKFGP